MPFIQVLRLTNLIDLHDARMLLVNN